MKKIISLVLTALFVFGCFAVRVYADEYENGSTVEFGSYPQTKVTDDDVIAALNSQNPTWNSYGFYSGGEVSDYMQYADVTYNSAKYRGVKFTSFRPLRTSEKSTDSCESHQKDNKYECNTVYWFKFEPLKWKVLDNSTGLVMSLCVIDAQAFSNTVKYDSKAKLSYNDTGAYASEWASSSLRNWLGSTFANTALNETEKSQIIVAKNTYKAISDEKFNSRESKDGIFLLSNDNMTNAAYDLSKTTEVGQVTKGLKTTDYAYCLGAHDLGTDKLGDYDKAAYSSYWLGTPVSSDSVCRVAKTIDRDSGYAGRIDGVRPAMLISKVKKAPTATSVVTDTAQSFDSSGILQIILDIMNSLVDNLFTAIGIDVDAPHLTTDMFSFISSVLRPTFMELLGVVTNYLNLFLTGKIGV